MSAELKKMIKFSIIFTILAYLFLRFSGFSASFPFYLIFDMDQIATLDGLLINSGRFPDHVYHTTFGVYLSTTLVNRIANTMGLVSALDLKELTSAINPYFLIAQITDFNRSVSSAVTLLIAGLWALFLKSNTKVPFTFIALLLLCIGTAESLIWQSAFIKSEQYSILFWLIGVSCLALSRQQSELLQASLIFASGIFVGLGFITKIQSFFFVIIYFLYFGYLFLAEDFRKVHILSSNIIKRVLFITLGIYLTLLALAYNTPVSSPVTGAVSYRLNAFGISFSFALIVPLLLQYLPQHYVKKYELNSITGILSLMLVGILASFLFHFFEYTNPAISFTYLLYDFKMVFLRVIDSNFLTMKSPWIYLSDFWKNVKMSPQWFYIAIASIFIVYKSYWHKRNLRSRLIVFACIVAVIFLNSLISVRNWNSDVIWFQSGWFLVVIICSGILFDNITPRFRSSLYVLAILMCSVLLWGNFKNAEIMRQNVNAATSQYGWSRSSSLGAVYGGEQPKVVAAYNLAYTSVSIETAMLYAEHYKDYLGVARFVFPDREIPLSSVGVMAPAFLVWGNDRISRLTKVAPELDGGVLIDPSRLKTKGRYLWSKFGDAELVRIRENMVVKTSSSARLPILPRRDLRIFLLTETPIVEDLSRSRCNYAAEITDQTAIPKVYFCNEIKLSNELDISAVNGKYFFVIKKI
jgi:hypothetical protein